MAAVVLRGDGWTRIDLQGDIDLKAIEDYRPHVDDLVANEPSRVVLSLEDVTFMDSTGLGFIVQIHNAIKPWGGTVCLLGTRPAVVDLIDLIGLTHHLEFVENQTELDALLKA